MTRNYKPRPCEECGAEFNPGSGYAKRCDSCKNGPKAKPCRTCGEPFTFGDHRAQYCPACRYLSRAKPPAKTCGNCAHGYEYQPGVWGCSLSAHRLCKPELFARRWVRREGVTA